MGLPRSANPPWIRHRPEAVEDLQIAAARLPDRSEAFYHLALALEQAHQNADALRAADRAVKLAPNSADARGLSQRLRR